jgi:hypothetical protein
LKIDVELGQKLFFKKIQIWQSKTLENVYSFVTFLKKRVTLNVNFNTYKILERTLKIVGLKIVQENLKYCGLYSCPFYIYMA